MTETGTRIVHFTPKFSDLDEAQRLRLHYGGPHPNNTDAVKRFLEGFGAASGQELDEGAMRHLLRKQKKKLKKKGGLKKKATGPIHRHSCRLARSRR